MKKIILAIAMLAACFQFADAQQVKSPKAAKAAVEKAAQDTANEKKADKPATWIKLGKAYMDAYASPLGNGWIGAQMQDIKLVLTDVKPLSTVDVVVGGHPMTKESYATCDYYYNENGILQLMVATEPVFEDALEQALAAYIRAQELDLKASKKKDLANAFQTLAAKFNDEAYNAYTFGDLSKASVKFEYAAKASSQEPYAKIDTNSVYNAGLTAYIAGEMDRAENFFNKSLELEYYGEEGDVYAKLADIASKKDDKAASQAYLEEAFRKFPQSQSILVGLINFYVASGENTGRLFELIAAARENEPNNASLYYVEGNIHLQLGEEREAVESYRKCAGINPEYEFGYIGEGQLYYNKAVALQEAASNEMDDKKYEKLVNEFNDALKACIGPFENAYVITKDNDIKVAVAEYLKNACYRFSADSDEDYAKYKKYDEIVKAAQQ